MMDLPHEVVNAAVKVLREELELNDSARVTDYIWEGQTSEQRQDALRRLKEADEAAILKSLTLVSKAISAALEALPNGLCSACKDLENTAYCSYCWSDE